MSATTTAETITPPKLAARWGIHVVKILTWIGTGELRAMQFATDKNGRPRYRIRLEDVEAFEQSRMVTPPADRQRRRRRRPATVGREYF